MQEHERWWEQAERDLTSARNSLKSGDYYVASLLAQQSAEKALKAFLLKKEGKIIKTHDLKFLGERLNVPNDILEKCKKLSPVYVETRYPDANGDWREYDKEESEADLRTVEEILIWIKKML